MENTGLTVRRATIDDIQGIIDVTKEAFVKYAQMAGLATVEALNESYKQVKFDIENKYVFVALYCGSVVGSVRIDVDHENKTGYLSRFGVSLNYQNLGIGKALMNFVDDEMITIGLKNLYLHTSATVSSLIIFYYGRGFYIESTSNDKGYIRALLVKNY